MKKTIALSILLFCIPFTAIAQEQTVDSALSEIRTSVAETELAPQDEVSETPVETKYLDTANAKGPFHRALMRRAFRMKRQGKITAEQLSLVRDALNSPNGRKSIQRTIQMEMAFSAQADQIPKTEGRIDWDKLGDFFERMIPLIITLIEAIISGLGSILAMCMSWINPFAILK